LAINSYIGLHVLIKTGRFTSKEGVIVSFNGREFVVRVGEETEALPTEDFEPLVASAPFDDKLSSPSSPSSPLSESSLLKSRPRRRGPKINFVGRFVKIESGKYKGEAGYVTRGGNGYYSIKFSADSVNAHETVMKRGADLTLVSRPEDFVEGPDFEKAVAEANAELKKEGLLKRKRRRSIDSDQNIDEVPQIHRRRRNTGTTRDHWMQKQVTVTSGKYRGEMGVVTKSGHGFYCVNIPGRGDVMKRATDIEIYDSPTDLSKTKDIDMDIPFTSEEDLVREAAFILLDIRQNSLSNESESEKDESDNEKNNRDSLQFFIL